MDSFVVSARKYRPSTFKSVVGQDALTTTLKNAIKTNKLAHAYLFCGPRGVGKTTCARIFAKTINCSNLTADFKRAMSVKVVKPLTSNAPTTSTSWTPPPTTAWTTSVHSPTKYVSRPKSAHTAFISSTKCICSRKARSMPF